MTVDSKKKQNKDENLRKLLDTEVRAVFDEHYKAFTEVQIRAGLELLSHNDVVVESPTGSGKTLAFLLPLLTLIKKKGKLATNEIGALILSPSRELATQIHKVATPFTEKLGLKVALAIGGNKADANLKKVKASGCDILIATPGRLYRLFQMDKDDKIKRSLKSVEILIADEADRFNESQFEIHIKEILSALPKQRRTGLFSATQAKERGDLVIFGLRNPRSIKLKQDENSVSPTSLSNFYTECPAAEKLICTVEFIRSKPDKKILVFFPSCAGVRYYKSILERVITKRPLTAIHGRSTQKQRADQIEAFRTSSNGVMLSTDVMSRGIDIEDIDWVVQFEIPKLSSWFVHRSGRTGRNGREGNALLILSPQQMAYVNFVSKHEQVELKPLKVPTSSTNKAKELREKMIKIQCSDREILEQGTRAFVSHVESYVKHDCNVVCGLKEYDVAGLAHCYALLRLPRMRELKDRTDLEQFDRSDIDTSKIAYANPKLEAGRSTNMKEKHEKKISTLKKKALEKREKEHQRAKNNKSKTPNKRPSKEEVIADEKMAKAKKRKLEKAEKEEKDDFDSDVALLRKMKKGRLSSKEMKDIQF